jgi:hypothetical protein
MPVWSYIIALLTGAFVAPFVSPKFRIFCTVEILLSDQKLKDIS